MLESIKYKALWTFSYTKTWGPNYSINHSDITDKISTDIQISEVAVGTKDERILT